MSPVFPYPEEKRGFHSILHLRRLNKCIHCSTFRMVILASIIPSLQAQNQFEALNRQDSYFPIASHSALQDVSAIHNRAQSLSVQNASICYLHSTRSLHKIPSSSGSTTEQMRYSHISYVDNWIIKGRSHQEVAKAVNYSGNWASW